MTLPPWAWILIALLVLLLGGWATNLTCPALGRSCKPAQASGPAALTADQQKLIESYF
jgi:hypothetical protein